jgi:glycosyltransferase involved in cell wall biosynthesis
MEAMKCGAPVVASNTSSIPEYVGRQDILFNPKDTDSIRQSMIRILTNDGLRNELAAYGEQYSKNFSWEGVVRRAVLAYESISM